MGPADDSPQPEFDELRSGFTAVVSHELRTPLARAMALLESGSDPATIVERVRDEIGQMSELVDDVLFLAELESGRAIVSLVPTKALPELRRVAADYAERAVRAAVPIEVAGDEELELPLRPRMLYVLAENLVQNALRYAGPGTRLRLAVEEGPAGPSLTATDDGVGVPEEALARLFERFYRGDRARTSRGTGLGLAIVKHIVTSAGGSVEARSATPHGLEVRCRFPSAR